MGLPSPQLANNGFAMLQHALGLLEDIANGIHELVRIHTDRPRNTIHQGAMAFTYVVGTTGITMDGNHGPNILDANPQRRGCTISNISAAGGPNISLGLGQTTPTPNSGLTLPPGASWDGRIGDVVWTGSISARATAAGAILSGVEA